MQTAPVDISVSEGQDNDGKTIHWVIISAGTDDECASDEGRAVYCGPYHTKDDANHQVSTAHAMLTSCGVRCTVTKYK